ncbi:MAG: FAD-binding oxidoreductase [Proteobacteria bacterium]|nr:FAD-binding oxidoreductase [Pseudomonadota bacterium]
MTVKTFTSWGNVIRKPQESAPLLNRHAGFPAAPALSSLLPYGNGRSYGDSCLNVGAGLIPTRGLDHFISLDVTSGQVTCEAGILFDDMFQVIVPAGWFVPVTPGTRFITLGGAIANDVHGKNHHAVGTIGRHIVRFELLRSDGRRLICSPTENADLFSATIGGLGLTGIITWAQLQLRPIAGPLMRVETLRFANLDEFLRLQAESDQEFEYTVAWVDCLGTGRQLGRGWFERANHSPVPAARPPERPKGLNVPFAPPFSLVNAASLRLFNTLYYHRPRTQRGDRPFESYFYPLDSIGNWNRLYGPRGLYQYQCVIPAAAAREGTAALLNTIARSGQGSFLAVLKGFGALESPGMLSFPREGLTLALDFPNRGQSLERLFAALDAIVRDSGGRLYPAKDGRMPPELFREGFPRWREFTQYIDPRCSSSFWRRVMDGA